MWSVWFEAEGQLQGQWNVSEGRRDTVSEITSGSELIRNSLNDTVITLCTIPYIRRVIPCVFKAPLRAAICRTAPIQASTPTHRASTAQHPYAT